MGELSKALAHRGPDQGGDGSAVTSDGSSETAWHGGATAEDPTAKVSAGDTNRQAGVEAMAIDAVDSRKLRWRPPYLRRTALTAFILLFVALMVALEVVLLLSKRPRGLATAQENLAFLWTLGPTTSKCSRLYIARYATDD